MRKPVLHVIATTSWSATNILVHSPDTDILVLLLRGYLHQLWLLCHDTYIETDTGSKHRSLSLKDVLSPLTKSSKSLASALLGLHGVRVLTLQATLLVKVTFRKVFTTATERRSTQVMDFLKELKS